jgi:ubiquinone/menaquinone biosynthesis C-methylase UbiE
MSARQPTEFRHPVFAFFYGLIGRAADRAGIEDRRRLLLARATGTVVEIGAGTGLNFPHYPDTVTAVIATEPERHMLAKARRAAEEAAAPVRVERATAEALPLPGASADTAVATAVLCSVADPAAALAELRRVLRPDGRFLFLEHVRGPDGSALSRWQDRLERPWGWIAGGCHPNRDTVGAIEKAGFELEELERFDFGDNVALVRPHASGVARLPAGG